MSKSATCTFSEPISFDIGFGLPCEEVVKRIKDDNLIISLDGCIYAESSYGYYGATIDITMSIEDPVKVTPSITPTLLGTPPQVLSTSFWVPVITRRALKSLKSRSRMTIRQP